MRLRGVDVGWLVVMATGCASFESAPETVDGEARAATKDSGAPGRASLRDAARDVRHEAAPLSSSDAARDADATIPSPDATKAPRWTQMKWLSDVVDGNVFAPDIGDLSPNAFVAITVDESARPHVAYRSGADGAVYYATRLDR